MAQLARSSIACVAALVLAAPTSVVQAAPSAAAEQTEVAADNGSPGADQRARELLRRAQLRHAAGDDAGAIGLLADALELSIDGITPRTEADIQLALLDTHEAAENYETADRIRKTLLRDAQRLALTPAEVARLEREPVRPDRAQPQAQTVPAPSVGRGTTSVVEEKVIESEIFSDRKMISSGIGLTTIGLGFGLGGAVLLIYAHRTENSLDEYDIPEQEDERKRAISDGTAQDGAGIAFVSIGGVLVLAGVILVGVGYGRKRARLGKDRHRASAHLVPTGSGIGVRF